MPLEYLLAKNISRRLGAVQALDGVSCTVRRGEILGLIGPNGAGKSTLFHCVAGTMPSDAGTVTIDGVLLGAEARKGHLFFMPDGIRPWPEQTLGWMLGYSGAVAGADEARINHLCSTLGLGGLVRSRMRELSKGEHKRALLAAALLSAAPLLLLDEPFDGLDLRQTRDAMALLRAERDGGRTLFLSIHQLKDASGICDRFVLLNSGKAVAEGTLSDLAGAAGIAGGVPPALDDVFLALT